MGDPTKWIIMQCVRAYVSMHNAKVDETKQGKKITEATPNVFKECLINIRPILEKLSLSNTDLRVCLPKIKVLWNGLSTNPSLSSFIDFGKFVVEPTAIARITKDGVELLSGEWSLLRDKELAQEML